VESGRAAIRRSDSTIPSRYITLYSVLRVDFRYSFGVTKFTLLVCGGAREMG
jgi:hypothetical protein